MQTTEPATVDRTQLLMTIEQHRLIELELRNLYLEIMAIPPQPVERSPSTATAKTRRPRARKNEIPKRIVEACALVTKNPALTAKEIASHMGLKSASFLSNSAYFRAVKASTLGQIAEKHLSRGERRRRARNSKNAPKI